MMSLLCLLCLAFIAVPGSCDVPWQADVIQTYFNGLFENSHQIATGHDYVVARLEPLKLPVFGDQQAFFIEEVYNGTTVMLQVGVVTELPGNRIGLKLYDFMNYTGIEPLSYDTDQLSTLQKEDLRTDDDCYAPFEFEGNRVLDYTYPDCKFTIDGKHPRFVVTYADCLTFVVIFPGGNNQQVFSEPYIVRRKGERYPVTYYNENFVSPCTA